MDAFRSTVKKYYQTHGRHDMPWRIPDAIGFDPYKILVSELMLQQTQVARVIPKYAEFLRQFPTLESLAAASQKSVLLAWSGLGYNRRALYLQRAAQAIVQDHGGIFPDDFKELTALPGIGPNTAGAILAYAFNQPVVYVETNIRTVYLHHFFADESGVTDKQILEKVAATVDPDNPREWYWALMDYGAFLKQSLGNNTHQSAHHGRQSTFVGSRRQIRGQVIRSLADDTKTLQMLRAEIPDDRLDEVLVALVEEEMIVESADGFHL